MPPAFNLECRACGSRLALRPGPHADARARECLACPVCWAVGPALEEAETGATEVTEGTEGESSVTSVPIPLGRSDSYRLLGCVRPDGPELEGEPRPIRELARTLWRLAGGC